MKILQVSMSEEFGGIEQFELNILRGFDKSDKIDFLSPTDVTFGNYIAEINNLGGTCYNLEVSRKRFFGKIKYAFRLYRFLKYSNYDIIHINSSAFLYSFHVVVISKLCKIKKIIVHSHSTPKINCIKKIVINVFNPIYTKMANEYISCSEKAKSSLFSKRFIKKEKIKIIKNAINIDEYKFNEDIRNQYREALGIENNYIYGHVGRFEKIKNHEFLINLFYELQNREENSLLLLIGEGKLEEKIKNKVDELGLKNKVIFLGFRNDVNNLLNCMDSFIMPSFSEGMPLSLIEAQINGLPTYCSNTIPKDVKISNRFNQFDLKDNIKHIAYMIYNDKEYNNYYDRKECYNQGIEKGYDIMYMCKVIKEIYNK